jgi:hypothetical protein
MSEGKKKATDERTDERERKASQRREFLTGALAGAAAVAAGTVNVSCDSKADADDGARLPRGTKLSDMEDFFSSAEMSMLTSDAKGLTLGQLDEQVLYHAEHEDGVDHFSAQDIEEDDYRSIEAAFAAANQRHVKASLASRGVGVSFASQAYADTSVSVCCCCCPCCSSCYAATSPRAAQTL